MLYIDDRKSVTELRAKLCCMLEEGIKKATKQVAAAAIRSAEEALVKGEPPASPSSSGGEQEKDHKVQDQG